MATTTPYFNPNWLKRQSRMSTPRAPRSADANDPSQAATGMYNAGLQLDESGTPQPTRDFGSLLRLNSSQMNPLSRGVKPGSFSSLGQPMNSMYANNPGFFRSQIAQRNQSLTPGAPVMTREQRIAQAQQEGTFGTIRDKYNTENKGAGLSMNKFGNIRKMTEPQKTPTGMPLDNKLIEKRGFGNPQINAGASVMPTPASQAVSSQASNRAGLEERAGGLKLLREMSQAPLQTTAQDGGRNITGQYGSGWSAPVTAGKKNEGLIGGRPASEALQGLANKQVREGTWRSGDRLPEGMTAEQAQAETEKARQAILSRQRLAAKNR